MTQKSSSALSWLRRKQTLGLIAGLLNAVGLGLIVLQLRAQNAVLRNDANLRLVELSYEPLRLMYEDPTLHVLLYGGDSLPEIAMQAPNGVRAQVLYEMVANYCDGVLQLEGLSAEQRGYWSAYVAQQLEMSPGLARFVNRNASWYSKALTDLAARRALD